MQFAADQSCHLVNASVIQSRRQLLQYSGVFCRISAAAYVKIEFEYGLFTHRFNSLLCSVVTIRLITAPISLSNSVIRPVTRGDGWLWVSGRSSTVSFYRATCDCERIEHTHGLAVEICLSVCPSNAYIVTKRNNLLSKFLYRVKGPILLVF